jgi:hypothetical protein
MPPVFMAQAFDDQGPAQNYDYNAAARFLPEDEK